MEDLIDQFFTAFNEDKRAEKADRAESSRLLLLELLTEFAMPERRHD